MTIARLGVVGDVHCEDGRLETALGFFAREKVDRVLAVGDYADGAGSLDRCCQLLEAAGALAVTGNHDRWLLDGTMRDLMGATAPDAIDEATRRFLLGLPRVLSLDTVAGRLLLCHGLGEDDMARLRPDDFGYALDSNGSLQRLLQTGGVDLVVGGHTHRRMVRRIGEVCFVNAGTLHRAYGPGCLLLDLGARVAAFYDLPEADEIVPAERLPLDPR
jgi:putative phosphoesterase